MMYTFAERLAHGARGEAQFEYACRQRGAQVTNIGVASRMPQSHLDSLHFMGARFPGPDQAVSKHMPDGRDVKLLADVKTSMRWTSPEFMRWHIGPDCIVAVTAAGKSWNMTPLFGLVDPYGWQCYGIAPEEVLRAGQWDPETGMYIVYAYQALHIDVLLGPLL